MNTTTFDPVLAEVIRRRLEIVCEEAAITLNRTSGSPILTEGHDFGTALVTTDGDVLALGSYLAPHFVSAMHAMRYVLRTVDLSTVKPGDHFAANDPMQVHPLHAADPIVISPIFADDRLVFWACCSVHILDIGGLSPGGWIPGAFDRFGEGFMIPLTKIVSDGQWNETFTQIFLANVRMEAALNDLRSCVAANNTATSRLQEVFERYGVDTVREYAENNIELSEKRARERIRALPDGTYTATDWVEYDGHGMDMIWRISITLTVRGDELLIDLSDSPPEANGYVNATRSGLLGLLFGNIVRSLFPDLPVNAGVHRPLRIVRSAPGTMLNPSRFAATSCGHMEAGTKVMKAFHRALHKAIGLSESPELRSRTAGLGGNVGAHNVVAGLNDAGFPEVWVAFDSLGTGLGAQINIDGRDCGCYEDLNGARMLDVEMEEQASTLYFYRRLCPNSVGHGFRRGGAAIDAAWRLQGMQVAQLTTISNVTRAPTGAPGGGYPGGGTGNVIFAGGLGDDSPTEIAQKLSDPQLNGAGQLPPSHVTNLPFGTSDVIRVYGAGGSGLGDPLFREPSRVVDDLENGIITLDVVPTIYGVVLDAEGGVDEVATKRRRHEIRAERLGSEPSREPAPMTEYRPPLRVERGHLTCNHCGEPLASVTESWKEHASARSWPLAERAKDLGAQVRSTTAASLVMWEFSCPACGSLLEVDVAEEGDPLPNDIRLGVMSDEPGEPF